MNNTETILEPRSISVMRKCRGVIELLGCALRLIFEKRAIMQTKLEYLTLQDKEELVSQMHMVQSGFVSCRRMAKELIQCHFRESGPGIHVERRTCDGCGIAFTYTYQISRPPDRPPICCSITCREKALDELGRRRG